MEGVEILSQTPSYFYSAMTYGLIWVAFCSIVGYIIGYIKGGVWQNIAGMLIGLCVGFILTIIFILIYDTIIPKQSDEYIYEVMVDNTVKLNEFYEKYEIIDQDGNIFEVKLRESL